MVSWKYRQKYRHKRERVKFFFFFYFGPGSRRRVFDPAYIPSPMKTVLWPYRVSKTISSSITLDMKCLGILSMWPPRANIFQSLPTGTLKGFTSGECFRGFRTLFGAMERVVLLPRILVQELDYKLVHSVLFNDGWNPLPAIRRDVSNFEWPRMNE